MTTVVTVPTPVTTVTAAGGTDVTVDVSTSSTTVVQVGIAGPQGPPGEGGGAGHLGMFSWDFADADDRAEWSWDNDFGATSSGVSFASTAPVYGAISGMAANARVDVVATSPDTTIARLEPTYRAPRFRRSAAIAVPADARRVSIEALVIAGDTTTSITSGPSDSWPMRWQDIDRQFVIGAFVTLSEPDVQTVGPPMVAAQFSRWMSSWVWTAGYATSLSFAAPITPRMRLDGVRPQVMFGPLYKTTSVSCAVLSAVVTFW
jgi:hypothetical protein